MVRTSQGGGCPSVARGSPEGHSPTGRRHGGCASINHRLFSQGESRGAQPHWQESEGVPQNLSLLISPFLSRKGARGMVRTPKGVSRGVRTGRSPLRIWQEVRMSRGVQPLWQEAWRMCLHKPSSLLFPLPSRKGARGMVPLLNGATQLKWWGESRTLLGSWAARNWAVTSVPNASFSHMESSQGRLCLAVWSAGGWRLGQAEPAGS